MENNIIKKHNFILDRLLDSSANIEIHEIKTISFLNKEYSEYLWSKNISADFHLSIKNSQSIISNIILKPICVDWGNQKNSSLELSKQIRDSELLLYFCGPHHACFVPGKILCKAWDDFFYYSDENSIALSVQTKKIYYNFNDVFYQSKLPDNKNLEFY